MHLQYILVRCQRVNFFQYFFMNVNSSSGGTLPRGEFKFHRREKDKKKQEEG